MFLPSLTPTCQLCTVSLKAGLNTYNALQLTAYSLHSVALRSGFRQQLKAGVDMTSDVKGWEQLFYVRIMFFPLLSRKSRSQEDTTVDHADIRGLVPTFLASVGCLPHSRNESTFRPHNAAEGYTTPGLRLFR